MDGFKRTPGGVFVPGETQDERRREMKSAQKKATRFGDVYFRLIVDIPREMPEDDFKSLMREYGEILASAFNRSR